MRQRDDRRAVRIDGKSERSERPCGRRHRDGSSGNRTVAERHDIDRSRVRIGLQRHEQTLFVDHTYFPIMSFPIASFDIASLLIASFAMVSFFMVSLAIMSFFF